MEGTCANRKFQLDANGAGRRGVLTVNWELGTEFRSGDAATDWLADRVRAVVSESEVCRAD